MSVKLARIDFRLIHGQVITNWTRILGINEIITIDEELRHDEFMQDVFKMAAPKGVRIKILSCEEAAQAQQQGEFERSSVMLLFKNVESLQRALKAGVKLDSVQVGGLGGAADRKVVHHAITLDQADLDTLVSIASTGIEVYFQTTADYSKATLEEISAKF
ncbi:PTS system sorbose subfamily IIB component [Coriobacterium glomerans PW2]|uniref:PTS system sorbose subfamily IIB component n=1 Tax=Coriobacterium glomerans (strain ATCC 49209 / DSM 20642 / JCM 10262 / PW2) TaxID=700015 RepID=F2NAX2_CORGP|nr:PTS sugar transporter subunit IIB [Coriobacterium glomerans]AEB07650.1 PTS system sorbose subfamily IIB component [Coriobacterium glomerans PW2]